MCVLIPSGCGDYIWAAWATAFNTYSQGRENTGTVECFVCFSCMNERNTHQFYPHPFPPRKRSLQLTRTSRNLLTWQSSRLWRAGSYTAAWLLTVHFFTRQTSSQCYDCNMLMLCRAIKTAAHLSASLTSQEIRYKHLCSMKHCVNSLWLPISNQ